MPLAVAEHCAPRRPVPMMFIFGTKDPLVPIEGGRVKGGASGPILSLDAAVQKWVALNKCPPTSIMKDLPNIVKDGTTIHRTVYFGCDGKSEVILYLVEGGGHTWPGGLQYLGERLIGKTSRNMDASQVIWEFFKQHSLD